MNKKELIRVIEEMRDEAQEDLEDNTKLAGMNAYGTGVSYGERDAFNRVLELLVAPKGEA